jgi:predicted  nucleic acid-binding Zn-ribbon protein
MKELMQKLLKLQTLEFNETTGEDSSTVIAELRRNIPVPILGHYDRLRVRGKKGLAAISHQVCTACHMRQPLGVILTLKQGLDVQLCHNCDRYLYLPAEEMGTPSPGAVEMQSQRPGRGRKLSPLTATAKR